MAAAQIQQDFLYLFSSEFRIQTGWKAYALSAGKKFQLERKIRPRLVTVPAQELFRARIGWFRLFNSILVWFGSWPRNHSLHQKISSVV